MKHELIDVAEPNLIREQFPYDAVPRIIFDGEFEKPDPAPDFFITDTTFRDGQQARPPYTAGQIVAMFDMLHRLGGPNGIIRQTEFFLYSKTDREAVNRCLARGYEFPEVTGWIRAVKADFKIVKEMGLRETGILTSASDYHIFNKLKKTRRAAMDDYLEIVNAALDAGLKIRCHLEDATRADFYGFVVPFVSKLMELGDARRASGQDSRLRHARIRRALPRRRAAAQRAEADSGAASRMRREAGATRVARAQRLSQGARQRDCGVALRMHVRERDDPRLRRAHRKSSARRVW